MLYEAAVTVHSQILAAPICPKAPAGLQAYADDLTGNVKWGILIIMGIAALVSLGSILIGRIFSHPHASRAGTMGLAVVILVAIGYVVILGMIGGITGTGCTG